MNATDTHPRPLFARQIAFFKKLLEFLKAPFGEWGQHRHGGDL
jgi:hypothetical protein